MARLATVGNDGAPDLVPIVFAVVDDVIYSAVDNKPKQARRLTRLKNIERDPRVTLLVDAYDEDWSTLWWCRARGEAQVVSSGEAFEHGIAALVEKYAQYRGAPPPGPVIRIRVTDWRGWSA